MGHSYSRAMVTILYLIIYLDIFLALLLKRFKLINIYIYLSMFYWSIKGSKSDFVSIFSIHLSIFISSISGHIWYLDIFLAFLLIIYIFFTLSIYQFIYISLYPSINSSIFIYIHWVIFLYFHLSINSSFSLFYVLLKLNFLIILSNWSYRDIIRFMSFFLFKNRLY